MGKQARLNAAKKARGEKVESFYEKERKVMNFWRQVAEEEKGCIQEKVS